MDSNRQLKLGVIFTYLSIGINILTGLLYTPWMISSIGTNNYGLYTLANSVIAFFMFDFGLSSAITRFVAKYLAEGRIDKVNNCLGLVYRLYIYIDVVIFIILSVIYFLIPEIYKELTPDEIVKFKVVYSMAAFFSVLSFPFIPVNGILTASEQFVPLKLCEVGQKILIVIAMTTSLLLGYGLYALVLVNVFAGIVTIIAKVYFIKKRTGISINYKYKENKEFKEIISFSGWTSAISFSQRFVFSIVPTLLGSLTGSVAIAIFGIANVLEGYVYTFASAIGGMFLPKVNRIYAEGEGDILPLMIKIGRIQFIITGAIIIGFICLGYDFINIWVGDSFAESYLCTVIIILPSFFSAPQQVANEAVLAKNKVRKQAIIYLWTALINLTAAFVFIYFGGVMGACIAICLTYFIRWYLTNIALYRKELGINVLLFYKETLIKFFPIFLISLFIGILANILFPNVSIVSFVIKSLIFAFAYLMGVYFSLNDYERELIILPLNNVLKKIFKH